MDIGPYQDLVFFAGGLVALIMGGQFLVRGAIGLGQVLHFSPLFTGIIIVAVGTSAPELFVVLAALSESEPDLAVGNIVGSNISNILLILGVAAVVSPILIRRSMVYRDAFVALLATGAFIWIAQHTDKFTGFHGKILLGMLGIYVLMSFVIETLSDSEVGERFRGVATSHRLPMIAVVPLDVLLIVGGAVLLYFGSNYIVVGASSIAGRFGVSEAIVGLSVVAVGTSLPELVTTIIAAMRRQSEIVIGNILGSNIFNILAVMGIASILQPVDINPRIAQLDMWIMLAATVVLIPFMISNWRLGRSEGFLLVVFYIGYMIALYTGVDVNLRAG